MQCSQRRSSTGTLLFAGLALFLSSAWAEAQVTRPFTADQVRCGGDQLRSVLSRSAIFFGPAYDERTATFLLTYAGPAQLSGLALLEQDDITGRRTGPERQLAFDVTSSLVRLRRNPAQPQLSTLYLLRDAQSFDLSRLQDPFAMAVVIDPTVDPQKNEKFSTLLVIDNLTWMEGGLPADAKVGRGLEAILGQCNLALTRADLHVLNVLARTVRATAWTTGESDKKATRLHKLVTLYRGEEATPDAAGARTSYRVDIFPLSKGKSSRVSLELAVELADDGSLGDAVLHVLPACKADGEKGCTSAASQVTVSVIQPVFGKEMWTAEPGATVCWKGPASCPTEVSFSFAERLAGTTWTRP